VRHLEAKQEESMEIRIRINDGLVRVVKKVFNRRILPFVLAVVLSGVAVGLLAEQLVIPFVFKSGEVISSSQMNTNFDQVADKINAIQSQVDSLVASGASLWELNAGDYYYNGGKVGIGTDAPISLLHLYSNDGDVGLRVESANASYDPHLTFGYAADSDVKIWRDVPDSSLKFDAGGGTRLIVNAPGPLVIRGGTDATGSADSGELAVGSLASTNIVIDGNEIMARNGSSGSMLAINGLGGKVTLGDGSHQADLDVWGNLAVDGTISQGGTQVHPDYVFEANYELESIEDHAAYMWENKHLEAVPKARQDGNGKYVIEYGSCFMGMLEELEKAHIYIEQLNEELNALKAELTALKAP
jgi:hypothetical protein